MELLFFKSIITSEINTHDGNALSRAMRLDLIPWRGTRGRARGEKRESEKNGRLKSRIKKRRGSECFPVEHATRDDLRRRTHRVALC